MAHLVALLYGAAAVSTLDIAVHPKGNEMTDQTSPSPASEPAPLSASDDKLWASLAHFGNIIPFIPALLIFLIFGPRGTRTKQESKEALNWTINITALLIILSIVQTMFYATIVLWVIGTLVGFLTWLVWVVNLIFAIIGGVKVNGGGSYRYPVNIRWIK